MTWHPRQHTVAGLVALAVVVGATAGMSQGFGRGTWREAPDLEEKVPYDGRFAFSRLRHTLGPGGGRRGEPPWAHDYPRAERNFMKILETITLLRPHMTESNIFTMDDPDLFAYPIAYMSEPGFWMMTDEELASLQHYIKKGGFVIFDDFRGQHWYNFSDQVQRLIPGAQLVQLDGSHPIFHTFFDIKLEETRGYYGPATFHGVYENNDPNKRLLLVAGYNHDLGELWEFSDTGMDPIDLTNDAYKYGVNYLIYAMTH